MDLFWFGVKCLNPIMKNFSLTALMGLILVIDSSSQIKFANKKSKEDFFKWIVAQQPEDGNKVFYQTIDLAIESFSIFKMDSTLGNIDTADIVRQIRLTNGNVLSANIAGKKKVVTNEKEDYYLKFSNPIFFDNDRKAWIYTQYWSFGMLGMQSIELYERTKNGYKKIFEIEFLNDRGCE